MDNQQAKFAYLAGLIDGEGCLDMPIQRRKNGCITYPPRVRISMTCFKTLQELKELIRSTGLPFWTEEKRREPSNPKWSPSWCLYITGIRRVQKWAEMITPYAITKKDKWLLLKEYCTDRLSTNPELGTNCPYTQKQLEIIAKLRNASTTKC